MNRTEAKAYALNELGLDRDTVRQFGNLSRTQTWLDAIAAQASGGIAAQEEAIAAQEEAIAPHEDEIAPRKTMIVEETPAIATHDAAIAAHEDEIAPRETMIVEETPAIAPEPAAQDNSFETFWDSAPALLQPQPLLNISALDGDWDDPEPAASQASEVIIYPIVIGLLMLWAMIQLLLLVVGWLGSCLTALANTLDAAASQRLQTAT